MTIFDPALAAAFAAQYPDRPARLNHKLCDHPLLAMEKLVALTARLPAENIEYNAGDLPVHQDPDKTPMNGLSAEETVRRIAECKSWLVLKNIESDPEYAALLDACLASAAAMLPAAGRIHKPEGFLFISSPGAVTPFHMDPEHNILMQARGAKTIHVLPRNDARILTSPQHEAFHAPGGHRNLVYRDAFDALATVYDLAPGDAVYVPVKAPHWVRNGADVSVSLSVTWRSRQSDHEAHLHRANAWLRGRGLTPPPPGAAPLREGVKVLARKLVLRGLSRA